MLCPFCKTPVIPGDLFCAANGHELPEEGVAQAAPEAATEPVAAADDGWLPPPVHEAEVLPAVHEAPVVDRCPNVLCLSPVGRIDAATGICMACVKQAVEPMRDSFFIKVSGRVAACSDRGIKHGRNEDSVEVGTVMFGSKSIDIAVVCDGVSSSKNPQEASAQGGAAAYQVLLAGAKAEEEPSENLLRSAIMAAQEVVSKVTPELTAKEEYGPPASTIVAVYAKDKQAYVGSVGDSRVYAISREGLGYKARLVTRDTTVLNYWLDVIDNLPDAEKLALVKAAPGNEIERVNIMLGLRYRKAVQNSDQAQIDEIKLDADIVDEANCVVKLREKTLHTMVESLVALPEGNTIKPNFCRVPLEKLVALVACSDGVWNDADPIGKSDASKLADFFSACNGDALAYAETAVEFASGADNNTCAVIILNQPQETNGVANV
jgi:serine/threonine protein phosphatase PrpC